MKEESVLTDKRLSAIQAEWFRVGEAAEYLRVSKRTIYRWASEGRLPTYIIGERRHRRYRKDDLDKVPRLADIDGSPYQRSMLFRCENEPSTGI